LINLKVRLHELQKLLNLEEVKNRFIATSDNLFNFIVRYDFLKEVDFNERVTIYCQVILEKAFSFSHKKSIDKFKGSATRTSKIT
jgi:hypothetical protein